jgi:probable rRNA maturation factor
MRKKDRIQSVRGVVFVNLQKRYVVRTASLWGFVRSLKRRLQLANREFNVCFVDDNAIRHLNLAYRDKNKPTDVLSFAWDEPAGAFPPAPPVPSGRGDHSGLKNFLGDVVISVETAQRNAAAEGHSTLDEIRWLILHGVLHMLGYDHESDHGEMVALELALREQLGVAGGPGEKKSQKAKRKSQKAKVKADIV